MTVPRLPAWLNWVCSGVVNRDKESSEEKAEDWGLGVAVSLSIFKPSQVAGWEQRRAAWETNVMSNV